ncbi:MAG TPA: hypothetical protein VHP38_02270 [Ruminiclostridium sp.]|nr:hypothetical protein [Ruminiclostridium sp.]
MEKMFTLNATDVRRDWSAVMESVVREKPQIIKRTRDYMVLTDIKLLENLLSAYIFTADQFTEEDGTITLSLNELDLAENAESETEARKLLGKSILEYAIDYYSEFSLWSSAPNRQSHVPYILKALIVDNAERIGESILCRPGKS